MDASALPILIFGLCAVGLAAGLLLVANLFNPIRPGRVKEMPYESGMDPFHDTRRRFDVRFSLLAIAFLVFDVELLFLYPWAVSMRPAAVEGMATAEASATTPAADPAATPLLPAASSAATESSASAPLQPTAAAATSAAAKRRAVPPAPVVGLDAAVAAGWVGSRDVVFVGAMLFIVLVTLGYVYDWRKGVFQWR